MSGDTAINWATKVWNPLTGCTRVSSGCDACYAFALHDKRHLANVKWAKTFSGVHEGVERRLGQQESWMTWAGRVGPPPEGWAVRARALGMRLPLPKQYDLPFSRVQLLPDRLHDPLGWRKPQRIFVDSMGDLFHPEVRDNYIDRVFAVMALSPQHTFQVLTKRAERMRQYLTATDREPVSGAPTRNQVAMAALGMCLDDLAVHSKSTLGDGLVIARHVGLQDWPLPNVWLGVSAEDQERADERIPDLLATPAAVRFLSCEPLLGPLDLAAYDASTNSSGLWGGVQGDLQNRQGRALGRGDMIIVGGESGSGARAFDLAWARSLRDQCAAAGVAFFMKQLGENAFDSTPGTTFSLSAYRKRTSRHGADPEEWPADLRVREWPGVNRG